MSTTIESLELEIVSNSKSAVSGLDALTSSLTKLKNATKGGLGLKAVANGLQAIGNSDVSSAKQNIENLVDALAPLSKLSKSNLSSFVTPLKNLPKVFAELNKIDMSAFSAKIQEVATAMKPLADEMQKVSNGFSAFPAKIQKFLKSNDKVPPSNKKATISFTELYHKMKMFGTVIINTGKKLWSAIEKSMDYTENMNLFTVSMGEYAGEAKAYAEEVSEAMGIDSSEWIRAQGIFMTMATGFGVAGDRAATMSKNLTQLGYDLSSFYNQDVEEMMLKLKSGLAGELEPLRAIGYDLSQAKLEATALELGIDKTVSSMTQAEKAQLRYYAIMTQVTTAQGDMARTLDDPANQVRVLKAEFNMAAREIGNIFIPALNAILPYAIAVTKVIGNLAQNVAKFFGYKPKEFEETTVKVVENTDAMSENLGDAKDEAKKLKSYLLGIDELNVLNPDSGSALGDSLGEFEFALPEYDFMGGLIESKVDRIVTMIEEALDEIELILSGASLALGAVLTFTGTNIPLGIALMAAGAIGMVSNIALDWSSMENPLKTALGTLGGIVGGALLANGAILAFSGANIPLGIALMAGGAIALTTAIALNWDSMSEPVKQAIGTLEGIVGGASLTVGALMAFSGTNIPLGIALMASGAVALTSAVVLNWQSLTGDVENTVFTLTSILSGALLGIGGVLAFSGVNVPLGIALMALGAVSLASTIAMNTNLLSDEVKGVIAIITTAVSLALLAVGAILAFTGASIPLGIALMLGGALTLGTAIMPNWNELSDSVKNTISIIMAAVGGALLALGAILAFTGVGIPLGIGLMLVGAASLGTAVALNWDAIVDALRGPVGLITAIVSGALLVLGAILLFTGVGIPLGLGLMLAGAAGLATVVAVNWDFIVDKIKGIWEKIKTFWNTYIAPVFTAEWWLNLGKTVVNGLASGFEWGINGIITMFENMINWVVDGLNSISFDVPDWVPLIGGSTFGFNIPRVTFGRVSIPKFAEGGFPEQGQMFIAREAGAEMVGNIGRRTAVANNDQIVASISGGVAEANEEQNGLLREQNSLLRAILEKDSGVYLDGKNLTDSVEKYQRERGRVLITGGVI